MKTSDNIVAWVCMDGDPSRIEYTLEDGVLKLTINDTCVMSIPVTEDANIEGMLASISVAYFFTPEGRKLWENTEKNGRIKRRQEGSRALRPAFLFVGVLAGKCWFIRQTNKTSVSPLPWVKDGDRHGPSAPHPFAEATGVDKLRGYRSSPFYNTQHTTERRKET